MGSGGRTPQTLVPRLSSPRIPAPLTLNRLMFSLASAGRSEYLRNARKEAYGKQRRRRGSGSVAGSWKGSPRPVRLLITPGAVGIGLTLPVRGGEPPSRNVPSPKKISNSHKHPAAGAVSLP
ncbi:hypothetical protein AAFF_G00224510 [Aldrovandia affinis]|uniref:Uncharacterized protein n=1 Tax=Aldrovandia affinis TaxID=143900 RepID=A0AAD7TBA6_9TELE|nr:hypothetical protein AAFF_G00224510 [Aldrovandia affinis]